jgi:hypothetical protein
MKIIKYTLDPNGRIPYYVIDGGYLAVSNNNLSPQDLDLIGLANDEASEIEFATEIDLLQYAQGLDLHYINSLTNEEIPLETVVNQVWSKLGVENA